MSDHMDIDPSCLDSAAYVLGVLPPNEQPAFLTHARTCPGCQQEIGLSAGLLPLLQRYEPVIDQQPTALIKARTVHRRATFGRPNSRTTGRGRPTRRTSLTVAALVAAAAVLTGFLVLNRPAGLSPSAVAEPPAATHTAEQSAVVRTFPNLGTATVEVTVAAGAAGSSVNVLCSGAVRNAGQPGAAAALISLWVRTRRGQQLELTAWTDMQGSTVIAGRTPVAPTDIAMFELRDSNGITLSHIAA